MFRAAQFIVRNKFVAIGAVAVGLLVFGRGNDEAKSVSPWDTDAAQQAAASANESLAGKALGKVAGAAKDYAGVDVGKVMPGVMPSVVPANLRKQTTDNWQQTGDAARRANGN
jgi:hypothetical protein